MLKQPLHTTIAIDAMEFTEFTVEEKLHIVISVKDFKSIVTHAGITNTNIKAKYSRPSSPMQLTYGDEGILGEFILMTAGETRGSSVMQTGSRAASKRPGSRQTSAAPSTSDKSSLNAMPPPSKVPPTSRSRDDSRTKLSRPSPPPPQPSLQSRELFLPETDDDRRWDPLNYENEDEDDALLLWDTKVDDVNMFIFLGQDADARWQNETTARVGQHLTHTQIESRETDRGLREQSEVATQLLPPTQRVSEVCTLRNLIKVAADRLRFGVCLMNNVLNGLRSSNIIALRA